MMDAHLAFPKSRAAGIACKPGEPGSTCSEFLKSVLPGETSPYIHLTPDPHPDPCLPQISLRRQAALCQPSMQGWEVGVNPAHSPA